MLDVIDWSAVLNSHDVDTAVATWSNLVLSCVQKFVPLKSIATGQIIDHGIALSFTSSPDFVIIWTCALEFFFSDFRAMVCVKRVRN